MPQSIRLHLDESCRTVLADGLRLRGIDVTTSSDAGLLGAIDSVQLAHACREGRVLLTHDTDFLAIHKSGIAHAGIVYCHQSRHSLGEMIRRLLVLWSTREAPEMVDRLIYL